MTSFRQVVSYLSGKTSASATPPVSAWEAGNRCRCSQIGGIRHTCAALRCMKGLPSRRMFCGNCFRRRNCFRHGNCLCRGGGTVSVMGTVSAARKVSRHQSRRGCMSSADCKSDRRPFQLPLAVASQPSSRPPPPRCLFVRSLASCQPPTPSAPCPPPLSPAVSQSPSRPSLRPERHQNTQKKETPFPGPPILQYCCVSKLYSFGPAATRALPASLFSYLWKLLMKRPARSFAFSSHTAGSE